MASRLKLSRLYYSLDEMARKREEPMWAVLDWAYQQENPFTMKQLFQVFKANGGGADSASENEGSFTTNMQRLISKDKTKVDKRGNEIDYSVSEKRPIKRISTDHGRGKTGQYAAKFIWALDRPLRPPGQVSEPEDDSVGDATDRLEKVMGSTGKAGLYDIKLGREKLRAAIERWKKMKTFQQLHADVVSTLPKKAQVDALRVGAEYLPISQQPDEEEMDDAVDAMPSFDDDDDVKFDDGETGEEEDDLSGFADSVVEPKDLGLDDDDDDIKFDDDETGEEDEPESAKPSAAKAPEPEAEPEWMKLTKRKPVAAAAAPSDDFDFDFGDDDDEETEKQAGASNFVKPTKKESKMLKNPMTKFLKGFRG